MPLLARSGWTRTGVELIQSSPPVSPPGLWRASQLSHRPRLFGKRDLAAYDFYGFLEAPTDECVEGEKAREMY